MNYAQQQRSPTRTLVGFGLVVLLHLLLIYALVTGLGKNIVEAIKAPIETKIIKDNKPPPPVAPPPPPPQLSQPPPPYVPPPDIQIQAPPEQSTAITTVTHTAPPPAPVSTAPRPAAPDVDVSASPVSHNALAYPEDMQEEEREGRVTVSCDVDTNGRTSNCAVGSVSGGQSFARAALEYAQSNTYRPATHNGVVIATRHSWVINFRLND